jgi:hypothetical protein
MKTFTIYPRDGEEFTIDNCEGFAVSATGQIIVHNFERKESKFVFLATDAVAAIVPKRDTEEAEDLDNDRILYSVYLKGRDKPVLVLAGVFAAFDPLHISFHWIKRTKDPGYRLLGKLTDFYFARSEVVAVFPSNGLDRRWYLE